MDPEEHYYSSLMVAAGEWDEEEEEAEMLIVGNIYPWDAYRQDLERLSQGGPGFDPVPGNESVLRATLPADAPVLALGTAEEPSLPAPGAEAAPSTRRYPGPSEWAVFKRRHGCWTVADRAHEFEADDDGGAAGEP